VNDSKNVLSVPVELYTAPAPKDGRSKLDPGAGLIAGGSQAIQAYSQIVDIPSEDIKRGIESICSVLASALERVTPESYSVEFSLGFKAGIKVPVLISSEANAALKITMNWKSDSKKGN
jgi:hypothetical protein